MKNALRAVCSILFVCLIGIAISGTHAQDADGVTLTPSTITWQTLAYELDANNGVVKRSVKATTKIEHTFDTYILENEYLKVTLLPEYGGRILSMIYKPTGHEELYQNPVGVPYGMGAGNFYYDWLMVYGGIFPTFPEPEHGKTWLLPWTFEVITETAEEVTVAMSIVDDVAFEGAPRSFNVGMTGLEATFIITLKAGRAALDTKIVLHNPTDKEVVYEYWTCTTLAPGSEPGDTRTTAGAEIIAPVDLIKMPPWWPATNAQEEKTQISDVYSFDKLRQFENWADMGIAYAYPDMAGATFSGVINHDNEEGIIRIGNNNVTPGLKLWTWGYDSVDIDPLSLPARESRPYIELWNGVTTEFFTRTTLAPDAEVVIEETYSPTVGLTGVTHANRDVLANVSRGEANTITLEIFSSNPEQPLSVIVAADGIIISETPINSNPAQASVINTDVPENAVNITFAIVGEDDVELLSGMLVPEK